MNRNVESHFAHVPSVDIQRSKFDRSFSHKTSFNVGELIPFYLEEVLPGDTFNVKTSKVVRLQTLLTPIFDNMYLDTYYFFVPMRLVFNRTKEFFGENTAGAWVPQTTYTIPTISSPANGFEVGTIADYLGIPPKVAFSATDEQAPIALPFRAYALICNEFFRDENLTDPLNIPLGDSNQTGSNGSNYINDVANGGKPFIVAKYHDYFTSCLPTAQKATQPVTFPLISGSKAPVIAGTSNVTASGNPLSWFAKDGTAIATGQHTLYTASDKTTWADANATHSGSAQVVPANLFADLTSSVGSVTVSQLRLAFQLQKYYERAARSGSRYIEFIKGFFGVTSPDARLQRPEYLGGNRVPVTVHEVTNTAQAENDFLGDLGAKSVTADIHDDFVHSFTEFGYIIGVMCCRYDHSYPGGLNKMWKRKTVEQYYNPLFASLGEMPVYQDEIFATSSNLGTAEVFGYNEAWAEYRFKPSRVSAEMRPGITNSLASWHLGDNYQTAPTLSDSWIREDKTNVDRVLAVTSAKANQIFCDIYVQNIATRPMPLYSIPGLIDHH